MSNRIANYFLSEGFCRGDVVSVFMENRPEFVVVWLGLSKMGAIPALVNYNLKYDALAHSVKVVGSKALVFDTELARHVEDIMDEVSGGEEGTIFPTYHLLSEEAVASSTANIEGTKNLSRHLLDSSEAPVPAGLQRSIKFRDTLMYIFTSGTTGLPKAAVVKHSRYLLAGEASILMIGKGSRALLLTKSCH